MTRPPRYRIDRSRVVILVRAAAEVLRRLHGIARRDPVSQLRVIGKVARGHVHAAADVLPGVHGKLPICKRPARDCGGGGRRRRRCAGAGRVARVGFRLGGVEVRREDGGVVKAFYVERGEDGLLDRRGKGVTFVFGTDVDEGEGCV